MGKVNSKKNIEAVTELLARLPANSHVTIIGITDHSLTEPDILLTALVPTDAGYFGERLNAARTQLVRAWRSRSSKLSPKYRQTDILGALVLAGQIFSRYTAAQRKLLIYSDMRNISTESGQIPMPDLHNVAVMVLGTASNYSTTAAWENTRSSWTSYFQRTGACLQVYSPTRDQ